MIVKKHIQADLGRLDQLYGAALTGSDPAVPIYYSKLGVLELSGWIEEAFDVIAMRACKNRIRLSRFEAKLKEAVKRNHGFDYDDNFLAMMARIVGLPVCEQMEKHLDAVGSLAILRADLSSLHLQRRTAAHVSLAGTRISFDAPSVSLARLGRVFPILKEAHRWICRL